MRRIKILSSVVATVVVAGGVLGGLGALGHLPPLTAEARARAALTEALTELATNSPAFSVAFADKATGERFSYRGGERFTTASVVKVSVLACTLLQAQDEQEPLTAAQEDLAEKMIRASDNAATTALFDDLGGAAGLTACNERLGLSGTIVDKAWGRTTTTADDQVRLLAGLVDDGSPLTVDARQYVLDLMGSVHADQGWGVPSAAREGESAPVKNGWDTSEAEGGSWIVNTEGRIVSPDRTTNISLVVLSHGNASMDAGITLVERAADLTREHLGY